MCEDKAGGDKGLKVEAGEEHGLATVDVRQGAKEEATHHHAQEVHGGRDVRQVGTVTHQVKLKHHG